MITAIVSAIKGPMLSALVVVQARVENCDCGFGTWLQFKQICSVMRSNVICPKWMFR